MRRLIYLMVILLTAWVVDSAITKAVPFDASRRQSSKQHLYDFAGILPDQKESTEQFLTILKTRYGIDAVIVSLPEHDATRTIQQKAVELFQRWKIGGDNGRGILLLLINDTKEVKLEVSLELEDVFTDVFTGYVEDKQLKHYFVSNQIGIGLIALMEELENRAQVKNAGDYTQNTIIALDKSFLSGGGGAKRDLTKYQGEVNAGQGSQGENEKLYPAGATAEEAWQTMLRAWCNDVRDPNLGVYTDVGKLAQRDFISRSNLEDCRRWRDRPYTIEQNENYAVISFGKVKGWENAPFLFCRTDEGWKFDMVNQRQWVRMGNAPMWGIERGEHPYMPLLGWAWYWMGLDIPWEDEDVYRIEDDAQIAREILRLEQSVKENPDDFETNLALGRLNTITKMRPKDIYSYLQKAKALQPDDPRPYKYLAIANVSTTYQYETAVNDLKEYIKRAPNDAFGYNFLGYLYLELKKYDEAVDMFKKALSIDPNKSYTYCKLARAYAQLSEKQKAFHIPSYKDLAKEMYQKAKEAPDANPLRLKWLRQFLTKNRIFAGKD